MFGRVASAVVTRSLSAGLFVVALLLVGSVTALAAASCPVGGASTPAMVEGIVTNGASGPGINGALIQWQLGKLQTLGSTDLNGNYAFSVAITRPTTKPQTLILSARANGYLLPAVQRVSICPGMTYTANFALKPQAANKIETISGQLTDKRTGKGIPNAIIAVLFGRLPVMGVSA